MCNSFIMTLPPNEDWFLQNKIISAHTIRYSLLVVVHLVGVVMKNLSMLAWNRFL